MYGIYDTFICSFAIKIFMYQEAAGCFRKRRLKTEKMLMLLDVEKESQMIRKHFWPQLILYKCIEYEQ